MKIEYLNNLGLLFKEEHQDKINKLNCVVLGCGGQGGYLIEWLVRLGINQIIFFDGDKYELSNINRQNGCTFDTIGMNKSEVIYNMTTMITKDVEIKHIPHYYTGSDEDFNIIKNANYIFDVMDYHNSNDIINIRNSLWNYLKLNNDNIIITASNSDLGSLISAIDCNGNFIFDLHTKELLNLIPGLPRVSQPAYTCACTSALAINTMINLYLFNKKSHLNELIIYDFYHNKISYNDRGYIYE